MLPIVLGSVVQSNRHEPLALAAGMGGSFVSLGLFVALAGRAIGLNELLLSQIGAVLVIVFGIILLVPRFAHGFELATAGMASKADTRLDSLDQSGLRRQFLVGTLLGAVWSPCVGPTLGGAISLTSQGHNVLRSAMFMINFTLSIGSVIVALGYATRELILKRQSQMRRLVSSAKPIMGAVFLLLGLMILFKFNHVIEGWLLDVLPYWLQDLSVAV